MSATADFSMLERAHAVAAGVLDPEIPVLTLQDLGVLHKVEAQGERIEVTLLPTYMGCPAMDVMKENVTAALHEAGFQDVNVKLSYAPSWSTDMITSEGHDKLRAYGIAPPQRNGAPACPRCGSGSTELISQFGSTACKAHWRCLACREPFDAFKCL